MAAERERRAKGEEADGDGLTEEERKGARAKDNVWKLAYSKAIKSFSSKGATLSDEQKEFNAPRFIPPTELIDNGCRQRK